MSPLSLPLLPLPDDPEGSLLPFPPKMRRPLPTPFLMCPGPSSMSPAPVPGSPGGRECPFVPFSWSSLSSSARRFTRRSLSLRECVPGASDLVALSLGVFSGVIRGVSGVVPEPLPAFELGCTSSNRMELSCCGAFSRLCPRRNLRMRMKASTMSAMESRPTPMRATTNVTCVDVSGWTTVLKTGMTSRQFGTFAAAMSVSERRLKSKHRDGCTDSMDPAVMPYVQFSEEPMYCSLRDIEM
mmetsp:Transcript_13505/g.33054  ORF Transcript_13505/g.33054 Transcript_13505/m.33054 type:complete len:241 (+) Transcript_13505:1188-1910(+)